MLIEEIKNKHLNVVSLFSGAGGLDIAVCLTGRVGKLFSTDANATFLQTVINNIPNHFPSIAHIHSICDAKLLKGEDIFNALGSRNIDLVIGGPPCDDFTPNGRKKGLSGDKAPLVFEYARLIDELKPSAFVFENVPALKQMWGSVLEQLMVKLAGAGYELQSKILEAQKYGVPSMRKRLFIVGFRTEKFSTFSFPTATHGESKVQSNLFNSAGLEPYVTVGDIFKDLPDTTDPMSSLFHNHTGRPHRAKTIEHLMTVPQGKKVNKSYRYRAPWDGICHSLTAGLDNQCKSYIHPIYHREMSAREYARIHGFPDSWVFSGTHHNGIKQVANAVPIPLAFAVLSSVISCLN